MSALDGERLARLLETKRFARSLSIVETTASTNDDARRAAQDGALDGHTVVADTQTGGRGARGNEWLSPPGSDLYVSIVVRTACTPRAIAPLTLAVGLGVSDAVDEALKDDAATSRIKWPNDVWLGERKCAGILVESASVGERVEHLVIGVGLNVNRTEFAGALSNRATSLALEAGRPYDRTAILAGLLAALERQVDRFFDNGAAATVEALRPRLAWMGREVTVDTIRGVLRGVRDDGALWLEQNGAKRPIMSGTLRLAER